MTELNPAWIPIITDVYLETFWTPQTMDEKVEFGNNRLAVEAIIEDALTEVFENDVVTRADIGLALYNNDGLLPSVIDALGGAVTDSMDLSSNFESTKEARADAFLKEAGVDFTDWDKEPTIEAVESFATSDTTNESLAEERSGNFNSYTTSFDSYMHQSAIDNELVEVPELFRDGVTLRNLVKAGWIRKLNPQSEEITPEAQWDALALEAGDQEAESGLTEEEGEGILDAFGTAASGLIGGVQTDEPAYYVWTEKSTDRFADWFATIFTQEELDEFYGARDIDVDNLAYEDLVSMIDWMDRQYTSSYRGDFIYNLTGDGTLSPENKWIDLSNGMQIAESDADMIERATQLNRGQIRRLAEATHENFGGDKRNLPWQIIALAIEQAEDYWDDETGESITANVNAGNKKYKKYAQAYSEGLNLYTDAKGTTFYELAYLHLLSPDLAKKVYNGGHDQLTVGEINFINESFSTIDAFHQNTFNFSPGWSLNMSTKNWLQQLSPGRMTESYLTKAQIEALGPIGSAAYNAVGLPSKEDDDLAQMDATKKAVAEKTYSDLYKQWFMDDPTEVELDRFMGWHAGKEADYRRDVASWSPYTSGQYTNPSDITDSTLLSQRTALSVEEALRNDPQYAQLYGMKPTGMTESEYGQVFSTQAMADYGQSGMLNKGLIKKGMASGDTGDITREGILTGEGYDNSQYMKKIMTLRNAVRRNT